MEQTAIQALVLFLANQSPTLVFVLLFAMVGSPLAVTVIILIAWIKDSRQSDSTLKIYRSDMEMVLKSYGQHIGKLTEYYEKNVELVKSWQQIAEGFRDTVVLNTQTLTKVCDQIENNLFCPMVRIDKRSRGPQG